MANHRQCALGDTSGLYTCPTTHNVLLTILRMTGSHHPCKPPNLTEDALDGIGQSEKEQTISPKGWKLVCVTKWVGEKGG